ncbi:PASTA domain protein OS=Streptomyces violarus OX=67380 GN=FHS41_002985 PE=4 SV=1 [Streptomyces violarus]
MAVDAREAAPGTGRAPRRTGPARLLPPVVDYVVRQYPPPGAEVPRGVVVTVWFDPRGRRRPGVREPRLPDPPRGGMRRELLTPEEPRVMSPLGRG